MNQCDPFYGKSSVTQALIGTLQSSLAQCQNFLNIPRTPSRRQHPASDGNSVVFSNQTFSFTQGFTPMSRIHTLHTPVLHAVRFYNTETGRNSSVYILNSVSTLHVARCRAIKM